MRPSPRKPRVNRERAHSALFSPRRNTLRFTIDGEDDVISFVPGLLCGGRPFAVFFGIPQVILQAINTRSWRRHSHIRKERLKGGSPRVANGYAARSIEVEHVVGRIVAACNHRLPNIVLSGSSHSVGFGAVGNPFASEASTRLCVSVPQIIGLDYYGGSARTETRPFCLSGRGMQRYNRQSTKLRIDKIHELHALKSERICATEQEESKT